MLGICVRGRFLLVLSVVIATGCSSIVAKKLDDKKPVGTMDGGTSRDGGGTDASDVVEDCTGERNGTACGDGFICVADDCVAGRCGDGIVDARTEQCDDGDEMPGDGCEPFACTYSCETNGDCDDGNPCTVDTCSTTAHECAAATPAAGGIPCELETDGSGTCSGLFCAAPGCGDRTVNMGEDCDDGANGDDLDGCRDDCKFTCTSEADCGGTLCNPRSCDMGSHKCQDQPSLRCDDDEPCTDDGCDPTIGCIHKLLDGDGDGFSPETCNTPAYRGDDCDDADPTSYPGGVDLCDDGRDNDCDGVADNGDEMVQCLRDADGDEYGNAADSITACSCPPGYIPPRSDGQVDCRDSGPAASSVHPGVTDWFKAGYCPFGVFCPVADLMYDYNCVGGDEKRWTVFSSGSCTSGGLLLCGGSGWVSGTSRTPPACGQSSSYYSCGFVMSPFGGFVCQGTREDSRRQECH